MVTARKSRKPHHDYQDADCSGGLKGSFEAGGEVWEWDEVARRDGVLRITLACESRAVVTILCSADEPIVSLKHRFGIPTFLQLSKGNWEGPLLREEESLAANGVNDGDLICGKHVHPPTAGEVHRMAAVETLSQLDDEAAIASAEDAEVAAHNLEPLLASVGQDLAQSYSSKLEKASRTRAPCPKTRSATVSPSPPRHSVIVSRCTLYPLPPPTHFSQPLCTYLGPTS
jgi:hypothetical protein